MDAVEVLIGWDFALDAQVELAESPLIVPEAQSHLGGQEAYSPRKLLKSTLKNVFSLSLVNLRPF